MQTNFENYIKGPKFIEWMSELLGNGIFNANGRLWKAQRQTASHLFKVKELRHMETIFMKHAEGLCEILNDSNETAVDIAGEEKERKKKEGKEYK
jgi:hypothetical protein